MNPWSPPASADHCELYRITAPRIILTPDRGVRPPAAFKQVDGELSQDAIIVQLQRTTLEARSYENGSLPLAKSILAQQQALITKLPHPQPELGVWLSSAQGMVALIENNAKSAAENFQAAVNKADALPEFDDSARLTFKQRLAFSYIRLGQGAKAEQLFRALIDAFTRVAGADSPHVLRVRLNLAQAFMIQNKHAEAIKEANAIYPEFVSRLGADHELTMQLLSTRAQSEGSARNRMTRYATIWRSMTSPFASRGRFRSSL